MIRNLYINEELLVSVTNNKFFGVIKKESLSKEIESKQLQFISVYPDVMNKLKEGKELQLSTNGTEVMSSIDETMGIGYSVPTSIDDLNDKLGRRR